MPQCKPYPNNTYQFLTCTFLSRLYYLQILEMPLDWRYCCLDASLPTDEDDRVLRCNLLALMNLPFSWSAFPSAGKPARGLTAKTRSKTSFISEINHRFSKHFTSVLGYKNDVQVNGENNVRSTT